MLSLFLDDIVMTSDADAFVASSDLMDPLSLRQTKVWIYRYGHGLAYEIPNFPMCFIAMRYLHRYNCYRFCFFKKTNFSRLKYEDKLMFNCR